jgi:hypothetical protein
MSERAFSTTAFLFENSSICASIYGEVFILYSILLIVYTIRTEAVLNEKKNDVNIMIIHTHTMVRIIPRISVHEPLLN